MRTDERIYYYVGVGFENSTVIYSYLCNDLTVKIGDYVLVPISDNYETTGHVVSAVFCIADETSCPPGKTKTVIRKVIQFAPKPEEREPAAVLNPGKEKKAEEARVSSSAAVLKTKEPGKETKRIDVVSSVITGLIFTPITTFVFGVFLSFIFIVFGWDAGESSFLPFVIAFPIAVSVCVYTITHPKTPSQIYQKSRSHGGSGGKESGGGWFPGCPEDQLLSSTDKDFDFNGDGHLDSAESSIRYYAFFGDDE